MSQPADFVSFSDHLKKVAGATSKDFSQSRASSSAAFEEMQAFILGHYAGLEAVHSFLRDGQVWDCFPVDRQPGLRQPDGSFAELARLPELSFPQGIPSERAEGSVGEEPAPFEPGKDACGNVQEAPDGCVRIRRLTLTELTRFESVKDYQYKPNPDVLAPTRRWATTNSQVAKNLGVFSNLSLWNPTVDYDAGQRFSLSQQWLTGEASGSPTQRIEGGWHVYPSLYGDQSNPRPHFFIFYTPDNYQNTYYNLSGGGFVMWQRAPITPGDTYYNWSTVGGQQFEISFLWNKSLDGDWWLFYRKSGSYEPVGYYRDAVWGKGPLATAGTRFRFGGEVVTLANSFPQMGSGQFANGGFGKAACQYNFQYLDPNGAWQWASPGLANPGTTCYTIQDTSGGQQGWNNFFYFGGSGGGDC